MIRRAHTAIYRWLAVELQIGSLTCQGIDVFGAGALIGVLVGMAVLV